MRGRNLIDIQILVEKLGERRKWRLDFLNSIFTGDYVEIPLDKKEYSNYRIISLMLVIFISVFHISAGFINNPGMFEFLVALSYIAVFFSTLYFFINIFQLPKERDKFRLGEGKLLFNRMRLSSVLIGLSLGICIFGEILFIRSITAGDELTLDYIFLALEIISAVSTIFLIRAQNRIIKKIRIV